MKKALRLPDIGTLHGLSSQARKEPTTITLFKGWTRLTTNDHGEMHGEPTQGFYSAGTQMLSYYEMRVNGNPIRHRLSVQLSANEWSSNGAVQGSADSGNLPEGTLPKGSIEVRVMRRIDEGWIENVVIKNNGMQSRRVLFELALVSPMRDSQLEEEMKRDAAQPRKGLLAKIEEPKGKVAFLFEKKYGHRKRAPTHEFRRVYGDETPQNGESIVRSLLVGFKALMNSPETKIRLKSGKVNTVQASATLKGRQELKLEICFEPGVNGRKMKQASFEELGEGLEPLPREKPDGPERGLSVKTSNSTLDLILGQAMSDLQTLTFPVFEKTENPSSQEVNAFIAGIPRYMGLFGRDNLITAWQSALFDIEIFDSVLSRIAALRGVKQVKWRDEEPDRLPHEHRINPNAQLGETNREIYYGDVTSTPFWILALSTCYRWQGDRRLLKKHESELRSCLHWVRKRLRQGNGYIYYAPALGEHPDENRNQAWKDSGDAIVDSDGRIRLPPLALVEIQAYAYQALVESAWLLSILGSDESATLLQEARELKRRFNTDFWIPEMNFFALALDEAERPLKSKTSNIGHALPTGIIAPDKIDSVVQGLMTSDMFSGWGIRTLSEKNPGYDPLSYHRGSVWPVENAFIADGFALHGYREEANRIITAQLGLAATFEHQRLPEVVGGHARDHDSPVPALYRYANLLQAWSVSAIAQHLQILLGIHPQADQGTLFLDPHLPEWLDWVELKELRFRESRLDLRFWRGSDGRSHWNVTKNPDRIVVKSGGRTSRKFFEDSFDRLAG